jgi:hypothetical protein
MNENGDGSTPWVEMDKTIAQRHAMKLAEDIRRLGEEAYRKGQGVRGQCEQFAERLVSSAQEVEAFARFNLNDIQVANETIRSVRARFAKQVHENTHERPGRDEP